jgi:Uncharacterized conserved protein
MNADDLPIFAFLNEHNIKYERAQFPDTTEKGAANVALALGYRERQMVKTLIFETDKGECALVMVGGDQNAISGHLKKALGSRNISMCKPEKVKEITGYVIGSIPRRTGNRLALSAIWKPASVKKKCWEWARGNGEKKSSSLLQNCSKPATRE